MTVMKMSNEELVQACIYADKQIKELKGDLEAYKAEVQARGIELIEDRNVKFIKFFGENGYAAVTESQELDTLNMKKLEDALGEGLIKEKVKENVTVRYKYDPKLEKALKAIFTGDYTFEYTLEEFLDEMSIKPDEKQKKLLIRKLKGDYKQDRQTLLTVLGYIKRGQDENETDAPDFDVELYYIYKIKNGELIKAFLPEEGLDVTIDAVKKCILVEKKTKIEIGYEEE